MLVKGRGMNTTSDRTPVAYLIRLIIITFPRSMTSKINHTEMTNFFFISISILVNGSSLPSLSLLL